MLIYKITNKINGRVYIGQTIRTLKQRFTAHCTRNGCRSYIGKAIKAHGKDNFTIEEIDTASSLEELNKKEIYWIKYYNSTDLSVGYNLTYGGDNRVMLDSTKEKIANAHKGKPKPPMSEERKKAISAFFKGRKSTNKPRKRGYKRKGHSDETKEKLRIANTGRKHTEETKNKIRENHKSPDVIEKIRNANLGKSQTTESKIKISKSLKGRIRTKEHQENLNKARKGFKHSRETKDKMRLSRLAYFERKKWEETEKEKKKEIELEHLIVKSKT